VNIYAFYGIVSASWTEIFIKMSCHNRSEVLKMTDTSPDMDRDGGETKPGHEVPGPTQRPSSPLALITVTHPHPRVTSHPKDRGQSGIIPHQGPGPHRNGQMARQIVTIPFLRRFEPSSFHEMCCRVRLLLKRIDSSPDWATFPCSPLAISLLT